MKKKIVLLHLSWKWNATLIHSPFSRRGHVYGYNLKNEFSLHFKSDTQDNKHLVFSNFILYLSSSDCYVLVYHFVWKFVACAVPFAATPVEGHWPRW